MAHSTPRALLLEPAWFCLLFASIDHLFAAVNSRSSPFAQAQWIATTRLAIRLLTNLWTFIMDTPSTALFPSQTPPSIPIWDYIWLATLLVALAFGHTAAYGNPLPANLEPSSGNLQLQTSNGAVISALLEQTNIHVSVEGIIARVKVEQVFRNNHTEWVEGEYQFPLGNNVAVDYMEMTIGNRRIVGKIREKEIAKKIYKKAKQAGKKASLVTQKRPNLFVNRVANIAPGETISVTLHYLDIVQFDHSQFSLRLPTTFTPRYQPATDGTGLNFANNESEHLATPMINSDSAAPLYLTAQIRAGIELDSVKSAYHDADVYRQQDGYELSLKPGAKLNRDVVLEWTPLPGSEPQTALFKQTKNGEDYVLTMVVPPTHLQQNEILPRETIFVIDTSGSMGGDAIRQAKQALLFGLSQLNPTDRFNIIQFNSRATRLWPTALNADGNSIQKAESHIHLLRANGGTEMADALTKAFLQAAPHGYVRQVVFITDGSVGNESQLFDLIHRKRGSSRLFTVGIGSAPNSYFMEKAAQAGQGSFTHIGKQAEIQQKMSNLFNKLQSPVMTNIGLNFSNQAKAEMYPTASPDLYISEPLITVAKLDKSNKSVPNSEKITMSGQQDKQAFQRTLDIKNATPANEIATLWARKKLSALYDVENQARRNGDLELAEQFKQDITDLALSHQIMSKYTSFVAVEEAISRSFGDMLVKHIVANANPAGNTQGIAIPQGGLGISTYWLVAVFSLLGAIVIANIRIGHLINLKHLG